MASRRRRTPWRRLRRYVIDQPGAVAEVTLGVVAGTIGLWLMLSPGEPPVLRGPQEQGATVTQAVSQGEGYPLPPPDDAAGEPSTVAGFDFAPSAFEPSAPARRADDDDAAGSEVTTAREPLIARLRNFGLRRAPDDAPQAEAQARAARAPAHVNRAGLRGEIVVGWISSPGQIPAAKPQEPAIAALPALRDEGERDSIPAWIRNAAVPPQVDDRPMIAVVLDDLGLNRRNTALVNQLPGPLTFAFLPYAGDLERQTRAARAAGHELMLHMPMEPVGQDWPGPDALLASLGPDQFKARLRDSLDRFPDFVGLNNHMGSRLTADREHMALVMAELRRRDLLFLDSKTTARSIASDEAERQGVPSVERDVFLDNQIDQEHIALQLARTEQIARERGVAVAIGHPHDVTISALRDWLPTLEKRGFALVSISTVVAQQRCTGETPMPGCGSLRIEPGARTLAGAAANRQS
jgi:polysaccharide deacetylase 2 family uncharacterized protein YibQ